MRKTLISIAITSALLVAQPLQAQAPQGEGDSLKMAAIEALMIAPPERALPVVQRLLASDESDEVKSRALFILSQIDMPEAHATLIEFATEAEGEIQLEAIRMIGISGDPALTQQLGGIYATGNEEVRESVLHAYLIADDSASVLTIAQNATDEREFESAVHTLGVMGATEELKQLRDRPGAYESLIHAYAIAGDTESLATIARDSSNPERQMAALQGLGIAGGDEASDVFMEVYAGTDNYEVKEAVMQGLMVSGDDASVLRLFQSAENDQEKADLLRLLVIMDSDAAMDAIDAALSGEGP